MSQLLQPSAIPLLWREGLSPEQAAVVLDSHPRLLVLAGAGSGKTRTLVSKVAELLATGTVHPSALRIFSFTRQACQELESRLASIWHSLGQPAALPRLAFTFHAFAWRLIQQHRQALALPPRLHLLTELEAVLVSFTRFLAETRPILPPGSAQSLLQALRPGARELSDPRLTFLEPLFFDWKQQQGLLELDDLVPLALKLLRTPTGDKLRASLQAILVDEFQDIDPRQWELVEALLRPQTRLALFGDDDQAIYRWRGSEPTLIRTVYSNAAFKTHLLTTNYRCAGNILALAAHIMAQDPLRVSRPANAHRAPGSLPQLRLSPRPLEEVRRVVQLELRRGHPPEAVAVLLRERRQLEQVHRVLTEAQIPVQREDDPPETRGVKLMTLHGSKGLEFPVVILPLFDRGQFPGTRKLRQHEQGLLMRLHRARRAEKLLWRVQQTQKLVGWLCGSLEPLGPLGRKLRHWLDRRLSRWLDKQAGQLREAEKLAPWKPVLTRTWQEWPQERRAQLSEERRLCYVAMTRAQDRLWLISSGWKQRSPYLDTVAPERVAGLGLIPSDVDQPGRGEVEDVIPPSRRLLDLARGILRAMPSPSDPTSQDPVRQSTLFSTR